MTADFAIINGGFAGLSAARRLLQLSPCAQIVVLAVGRLAEGASRRNSGFMIDLPHDRSSHDYAGQGADGDSEIIALNRTDAAFFDLACNRARVSPFQCRDLHSASVSTENPHGCQVHNCAHFRVRRTQPFRAMIEVQRLSAAL